MFLATPAQQVCTRISFFSKLTPSSAAKKSREVFICFTFTFKLLGLPNNQRFVEFCQLVNIRKQAFTRKVDFIKKSCLKLFFNTLSHYPTSKIPGANRVRPFQSAGQQLDGQLQCLGSLESVRVGCNHSKTKLWS